MCSVIREKKIGRFPLRFLLLLRCMETAQSWRETMRNENSTRIHTHTNSRKHQKCFFAAKAVEKSR